MKIAILGGSITGCICSQLLSRAGHDVVVYESVQGGLAREGAGFTVAADIIDTLVTEGLISQSFAATATDGLAYLVRDRESVNRASKECFFADVPHVHAFWGDLWAEVRRGVPDDRYISGARAASITQTDEGLVVVDFAGGLSVEVDLVVCADGARSVGRKLLYPELSTQYAGYFGWRGMLPGSALNSLDPFDRRVNLVWRQGGGQSAFYCIERGGEPYINWVVYIQRTAKEFAGLLQGNTVDADEKPLTGFLTPKAEAQMKAIVANVMPAYFAEIITKTPNTFAHAIRDVRVPSYNRGRVLLVGDAGTLCRPHAEMGVAKGLFDAMTLARLLSSPVSQDDIDRWGARRAVVADGHFRVGQQLGRAFVFNVPDMETMDRGDIADWLMSTTAM